MRFRTADPIGPTGNRGADNMVNLIAHELTEAATDPLRESWVRGEDLAENADLCAWKFGQVYTTPNGAKANHQLHGRDYLIQKNWNLKHGGFCADVYDDYPPTATPVPVPSPSPPPNDLFRKSVS